MRLHHLTLHVADLAAASADWAVLVGAAQTVVDPTSRRLPLGEEYLELRSAGGSHRVGSVEVFVSVADLPAAAAALAARGVSLRDDGPAQVSIDPAALTGVHVTLTDAAFGRPVEPSQFAGVNHLVVAVSDLEKALQHWTVSLGLREIERPGSQEAAHHLPIGRAWFGLTVAGTDGPAIARFVERRGEGIYAVGLRVEDRARVAEELSDRGVRLIEAPSGQIFIHPAATHGLLVDLVAPTH